jgi:hypothetical protein
MRLPMILALTMCASGCANVAPSPAAICDGTAVLRTDHAAALAQDGGPRAMATGARLIRVIDAGCGG